MNKQLNYTSVRLGSVAGGAKGLVKTDFMTKMTQQAIDGKSLTLQGGKQQMDRVDVRDAVEDIDSLLEINSETYKPIYNFSSGETHRLSTIAHRIAELTALNTGNPRVDVVLDDSKDIIMDYGMDSARFFNDINWKPVKTLDDTIESLIEYISSKKCSLVISY